MTATFKEKVSQEISDWENTGLSNAEQAALLPQRYDPTPFQGAIFLKWLGLFAVFMLGLVFLGFSGIILGAAIAGVSAPALVFWFEKQRKEKQI